MFRSDLKRVCQNVSVKTMFAAANVMEAVAASIEPYFSDQTSKIEVTIPKNGTPSGSQPFLNAFRPQSKFPAPIASEHDNELPASLFRFHK